MATDLSLLSKEQLLRLINTANGSSLTLEQIDFDSPVTIQGNKNTSVSVIALPNGGLKGNVSIIYNRMNFGLFETLNEPEFIVHDNELTPEMVVAAFNAKYGTNLQVDEFDFSSPLPSVDADGETYSLTPKTSNLIYVGGLELDLKRVFSIEVIPTYNTPSPISAGASGILNGKLYVAGGIILGAPSPGLRVCDLSTMTWTYSEVIPATYNNKGCAGENKIFFGSGQVYSSAGELGLYSIQDNNGTPIVTRLTSFPYGQEIESGYRVLYSYELVADDLDNIHLIGGFDSANGGHVQHWVYYTGANTWEQLASLPSMVGNSTSVFLDGKIYLVSGLKVRSPVPDSNFSHKLYCYDTNGANAWIELADIPMPVHDPMAVVVENQILVYGGNGLGNVMYAGMQIYNPASNTWTVHTEEDFEPRVIGFIGLYNGDAYLWGGSPNIGGTDPFDTMLKIS